MSIVSPVMRSIPVVTPLYKVREQISASHTNPKLLEFLGILQWTVISFHFHLIIIIIFSVWLCQGEQGSEFLHSILNSLIAHWKSLCGPICSAALSKCSSFGMPTCLASAINAMQNTALLIKSTIQKNNSSSVKIWSQVCPDTDLALRNNVSV